jgi:hypothetical protein
MKKAISIIAMTLMLIGLTGCMDDPDGSKQTTRKMQNT